MKRLILFRHAKSAWPDDVTDHERPLAERGRKAAPLMGKHLKRLGLVPDLALVSTALRTRQTWELAAPAMARGLAMREVSALYEAPPRTLLEVIARTTADIRTLLVLGHNPGLEDLARTLAGDDAGDDGSRLAQKFPTAAIAAFEFEIEDWVDVARRSGRFVHFAVPRNLA